MPSRRLPSRQLIHWVALVALAAVFLIAILAFPFFLQRLAGGGGRDWQTLSDVGQAYGAISALLSGLALCGVAFSVTLQRRQVVWARMVSARERHFELIKLMLEDPELSHEAREGDTVQKIRGKLANNLWVSHWLLLWDIDEMDQEFLRSSFDELFVDLLAREWWCEFGPTWIAKSSRRHSEFMRIAWSSYHKCAHAAASISTANSQAGTGQSESRISVAGVDSVPAVTGTGGICREFPPMPATPD